jgi:hypothetical protein
VQPKPTLKISAIYKSYLVIINNCNHCVFITFEISAFVPFTYNQVSVKAAADTGTYKQQLPGSIWFLRTGILFTLKVVHLQKHFGDLI